MAFHQEEALSDFVSDFRSDLENEFVEPNKILNRDEYIETHENIETHEKDWHKFCKEKYAEYVSELRLRHC